MVPQNEQELARLALEIIGKRDALTEAEQALDISGQRVTAGRVNQLRAAISAGRDPLGVDFIRLRSPEARRTHGAVFTPTAIVDAMLDWTEAEAGAPPTRIVDPGAGSGRFLFAAARRFPRAQLVAFEIDPLAALLLRANAVATGFADRFTLHLGDYRKLALPKISERTLFIGNPPYVRHHQISTDDKKWFASTAERFGFRASKLAGLHVHFFLRTREIARPGDFGTFITSSEWMDVNYGAVLRSLLGDGLGGTALHILHPAAHPFENALTTGVITCFRVGNRPDNLAMRTVKSVAELKPLSGGTVVPWSTAIESSRWSTLVHPQKCKPFGWIELGELFRVHRGQVTGGNGVWIADTRSHDLPIRFLFPAITRARELFQIEDGVLARADHLRRVIDLPVDLDELKASERLAVEHFLSWARTKGADQSYVATHRRAWWSVGLREPPPILCTYMARRPPVFIRNDAGARHINIAHGLYPRQSISAAELDAILRCLRETVGLDGGRTYAGGLVKYEPGEVERLHIPDRANLIEYVRA